MSIPNKKNIIIVGAGPGGLTCGMILAHRGFNVTLFEEKPLVGGRNAAIRLGDFTFDTGPTFLMLKDILDEVFEESGASSEAFLKFKRLEPMYRLAFKDKSFEPTTDREAMKAEIAKFFPGQEKGLDKYFEVEKKRFELMYPCLQKDYASWGQMLSKEFRRALPHLSLGRTLMDVLGDYFTPEDLRIAFTFQAKYIGMSPWECPGAFGILSYIEHGYGVYHTEGGLSAISDAMAKNFQNQGGTLKLNTKVKQVLLQGRCAIGVELENGEQVMADEVVINADFGNAMQHLMPKGSVKKWSPKNLLKKEFSCSTFMLYLGLDKIYDMPHHTIVFADDYKKNVENIFRAKHLPKDSSFYIRNASINDPTLAPKGKSAVYVLVPVSNLSGAIDWVKEKSEFRNHILKLMADKTVMNDIESHIEEELIITPNEWENDYHVFLGATFNLGHTLKQMLYFRPRNKFEEIDHVFLVGGGTHPGSGLPTIYESGRISANLISRKHKIKFTSKNLQA